MKLFLAAAAATMLATAAFAADPVAPPAPSAAPSSATPASTSSQTCAQLITQARGMTLPSDSTKATQIQNELAAADAANDDSTCKTHANAALNLLSGM